MSFYRNVDSHKEGDLLRIKENEPIYIWYKERWRILPRIYQETFSVLDNKSLPKNMVISRTLRIMLMSEEKLREINLFNEVF